MAPAPFEVKDFDDYCTKMGEAFVVLDPDKRKDKIKKDLLVLAKEAKSCV